MPFIETRDGAEIYFKDWGQGDPVILIHGWPLNADSWDPIAEALAHDGHRVISYDRRGFGRSEQSWGGYDYDSLADDLADVMVETGAVDNVTLVGFSMGGGEVARYMSRHDGQGVVRAALIASVVPYMLRGDDNPDGVPQATFDEMAAGIQSDRPAFMRSFLDQFFGVGWITKPVSSAMLDNAWAMCMGAGLHPTLECAKAFASTDFRPDLASFEVPTLIVHGTSDKTVPIDATARAASKAISNSQLVEYVGAPHGLFETDRDRLIADLKSFLAGETIKPREEDFANYVLAATPLV